MGESRMKTILCVEDNADNLKVLQLMIGRLRPGDRFIPARTAEEAFEILNQVHPDLILMDVNLPGMSGIEAMSILRQPPHVPDIPVIAISAHAMASNINEGLQAGFADYITKPIDMHLLDKALKTHLSEVGLTQAC